jgi:hypothetical protein
LNIVFATGLMFLSLSMAAYTALMPMSQRAMTQMQKKAEADLEAKRQADLKAVEEAEKSATTPAEKQALQKQRKALETTPKVSLPIGMDLEKLGFSGKKYTVFSVVDVTTALVLDVLLLVAGIGLIRRRMWALRLGIGTAAAKIVRLVLVYGFVILVVIPPLAQGSGRVAFEGMIQQMKANGQGAPAGFDAAFFTRMYYIMYTVMAVAMILFGSLYPAISLWFLSRPGARSACEERARQGLEGTETRVVGIVNIIFATCLILFGLCMGAYITALPILGRTLTEVQKSADKKMEAKRQEELKSIEEALKKAATEEEKQQLEEEREAISTRPKVQITQAIDPSMMGLNDPKVQAYYWIELASGLILNVAMIAAGIALVRQKPWGITLGIGTAVAKIVRLVVVYTYFALVVASIIAQRSAEMVGRMMSQQQAMLGTAEPPAIDSSPLVQVYERVYGLIPFVVIVLGSLYPAISLYVLTRARASGWDSQEVEGPQSRELNVNETRS